LWPLIFSFNAQAVAERVDVYFLSRPLSAINLPHNKVQWHGLYAQNDPREKCIPMGDGCFHPQLGYIENYEKEDSKKIEPLKKEVELKTINAEEVNLIDCDQGYYFDMYCGKANAQNAVNKAPSEFELWIDTSTSMRLVDYSSEDSYCDRRRFIASLKNNCKKELQVSVFNTAKKRLSTLDNLCINYGANNGEKVVSWLKSTQAKQVVIITDVEEYVGAFREYLDAIGATIHGIGVDPLLASELISLEKDFLKYCK